MTKRTQGEWYIYKRDNKPPELRVRVDDITDLLICTGHNNPTLRMCADFALIASSPDLLAACEKGGTANEENVLDYAADLIESLIPQDNSGNWEVARTLREKARMERAAIAKARGGSE